jgi:hypothetical protein
MARSSSLPHRTVRQAKASIWRADGVSAAEIGRRCQVDSGVGVIARGRGRRSWLPDVTVAEVVRVTLEETPEDTSTHWTTRTPDDAC